MKKVILCIMDGVGIRKESLGNAYLNAKTPTLDKLIKEYPNIKLSASGNAVGLPAGVMGNSEVGHMTIGSGRVIYQSLEKINRSIEDESFYGNKEFISAITYAKDNNSKLHLIGLLSDGGIHSDINHLFSLLELCRKKEFKNVYIHVITDGRDTSPTSGIKYINMLLDKIKELGVGKIATLCGRYYMMDRDNNYDRISLAYNMLVNGEGREYDSIEDAWMAYQNEGITDEFMLPAVIDKNGIILDNDAVIVYNYRPDRLREICTCLTNKEENSFERIVRNNLHLVTMMPIANSAICTNAFYHEDVNNTLGQVVEENNLSQLRIAETEKYAHVTHFFDGDKDLELNNCKKILIPSPKVATYDLKPEMSAYLITDNLLLELKNEPDLIVLNFANGDMVGHTGMFEAGVKAVEVVDRCIEKIITNLDLDKYTMIITADHGNCEEMINKDGSINTQHTTNLVPLIILDKKIKFNTEIGGLSDIAPSILKIMGIEIPKEMDGRVLIL